MARRKRRGGRRRKARSTADSFGERTLRRDLADDLQYESHKAEQSEYLAKVALIEQDLLSRNVFVTQVRDLTQNANLRLLQTFLEGTYGLVEICEIAQRRRGKAARFPAARVRFRRKQDAEKIFGGAELKAALAVHISKCPVQYKSAIRVVPSEPYEEMTQSVLTGSKVEISTTGIALGYWFPAGEDSYYSENEMKKRDDKNEWLEEENVDLAPSVTIDLTRRVIEFHFSNPIDWSTDLDGISNMMKAMFPTNHANILAFRFKDILGYLDLCQDQADGSTYSLLFRLKYPPKLWLKELILNDFFKDGIVEVLSRQTRIGGFNSDLVGYCLSYRLTVGRTSVNQLLLNETVVEKLRKFGIVRQDFASIEQCRPLVSKRLNSAEQKRVESNLARASLKAGMSTSALAFGVQS
jgi:hypothetical protein